LDIAQRLTVPLLTCEAVIAETTFHVRLATLVLAFIEEGLVRLAFQLSEHTSRLKESWLNDTRIALPI
jgi:hypothetical protein